MLHCAVVRSSDSRAAPFRFDFRTARSVLRHLHKSVRIRDVQPNVIWGGFLELESRSFWLDTIPLRLVRTRPTERSRAAKSNQWRQSTCRSLSHPLPRFCRHLSLYDTADCRQVLRFVAVRVGEITIQTKPATILLNAPATR